VKEKENMEEQRWRFIHIINEERIKFFLKW
jgi:hypothetical protein